MLETPTDVSPRPSEDVATVAETCPVARFVRRPRVFWFAFGVLVAAQALLCFQGLGDQWTRGHNGFNGSAYHLAARNTARWGDLFPLQYYTSRTPPTPADYYTHHPLAMHLHNVASFLLFGDHEASIRLVPALHSVLLLIALMLFVRRFWDPLVALLAGLIYLALPINGIFANMQNHPAGCLFWSLVGFTCYLRFQEERARLWAGQARAPWLRWMLGLFAATFMATAWEWPAYYTAFFTAVHWFSLGLTRQVRSGRRWWKLGGDVGLLVPYGLWVLALAAFHFLLVRAFVGDLHELGGTIGSRLNIPWDRFMFTVRVVPELMFTWPVLVLSAVGFLRIAWRLVRGRFQHRDLMLVSFCIGGILHFLIFKWSSIVHEYWLWTTLPFAAVATATGLIDLGRWLRANTPRILGRLRGTPWEGRIAVAAGLSVYLLLVPLFVRSIQLVPRGKEVGGSMWFVAPTRPGGIEKYDSGRPELRFADQVRSWTDRSTGVLYHDSIDRMRPESRFDTTLDREMTTVHTTRPDDLVGPERLGITGWVFIAAASAVPPRDRAELAARHPWRQFGDYVMVDLRTDGPRVEVWRLEEQPFDLWWWYWHSAFEPPVVPVRDAAAEAALQEAVRTRPTADPAVLVRWGAR